MAHTPPLDEGAARTVGTLQGNVTVAWDYGRSGPAELAGTRLVSGLSDAGGGERRSKSGGRGDGQPPDDLRTQIPAVAGAVATVGNQTGKDRRTRIHYEESRYGTAVQLGR